MRKLSFLFTLIFIGTIAFAQNFKDPHISVAGKAEIEVVPDIIHLSIRLSETTGNKKMTVEEKETLLKGILAELNIDQKNLTLTNALSHFDKSFWKKDEVKTSKSYNLKLTDAETLGKVMIACRDKDLSEVSISKVDHSKRTELIKKARIQAIKAAKEKAIYLTEAIGQKVGKALSISEQQMYFPRAAQTNMVYAESARLSSRRDFPKLKFKKIIITAEISAVFQVL